MPSSTILPSEVLKLTEPTPGFLCPLSANVYGLEFLTFFIRDSTTKKKIFEISKESVTASMTKAAKAGHTMHSPDDPDSYRKICYDFSLSVLRSPMITTDLTFSVGAKPIEKFRMIERHYFKNRLIKSFDFTFGFCMPGSTNNWEASYSVPRLEPELLREIVKNPYQTTSDSFYFDGDSLILHNKASYCYYDDEDSMDVSHSKSDEKVASPIVSKAESKYDPNEERQAKKMSSDDL